MPAAGALLVVCGLVLGVLGKPSPALLTTLQPKMKEGPGSNSYAEALEARASLSLSLTIHETGKSPYRLRPRRSLAAVAQGSWDTVYPYCSHFAYLIFDSRDTITQPVSDKTFLRTVSYTFTTTLRDFCSQILKSDVKPGFPKTIKTNNPDVLRAARHSAESFNNCSNDAFLFRESRISRALVQIVKGLKFMLDVDIGRTTCRKNGHANLDDCGFQTNRTLQWTLSCYSEVWVIPWLQTTEVSVLHCH